MQNFAFEMSKNVKLQCFAKVCIFVRKGCNFVKVGGNTKSQLTESRITSNAPPPQ